MTSLRLMVGLAMLVAATAAGGYWWQAGAVGMKPASLAEDGIGPLRLESDFRRAERLAFRLAPDTAFSGPGCSGLDEIRYETLLGDYPVSLMAMAAADRIQEIEAAVLVPNQADSLDSCVALRDSFAEVFIERFGDYQTTWKISKPVSQELMARTGPVLIKARWFRAGGSCNISAHFSPLHDTTLWPESALALSPD